MHWLGGIRLHGDTDIRESDSAVSLTFLSQTQRCHWHQRVRLSGVIDIYESDSAVSLTSESQTQRCHWHQRVRLSGVIDISESESSVSLTFLSQTHRCHWHFWVRLSSVIDGPYFWTDSDISILHILENTLACPHPRRTNFKRETNIFGKHLVTLSL